MNRIILITAILAVGIGTSTIQRLHDSTDLEVSSWCPLDDDTARRVLDAFLAAPEHGAVRNDLSYGDAEPVEFEVATHNTICEMVLWDPRNQAGEGFFPTIYRHIPSNRYVVVIVHERSGKPDITEDYIDLFFGRSVLVFFDVSITEEARIMF